MQQNIQNNFKLKTKVFIVFNMQIMPTYESVLGYNLEIEEIG